MFLISRMTFNIQDNPVRGSGSPTIPAERSQPTPRSFVVRNRARASVRQTSPPPPPPPAGDVFNPFINPALSSPGPATTSTAATLSSSENIKKLSSSRPSVSPHRASRITIPRLKSSTASKENIVDSQSQSETRKLSTNIKKENPETKQKSTRREKKPKQKKVNKEKEKSQRQKPSLAPGCVSICNTLIFEVYQLLGGSVCDC